MFAYGCGGGETDASTLFFVPDNPALLGARCSPQHFFGEQSTFLFPGAPDNPGPTVSLGGDSYCRQETHDGTQRTSFETDV
jgi:hypothetical protein